ncbi:2-dehydropantoate 2-reductase [Trichodelitschia bisporula]|uniref:2-dehydropantoate 2-reductase n=1 Tax=Trichodelitschia bisporula TaxID=703511 RepID=A0A6G1HNY3_9PEZI|nr:2-dehydropantoate 2-reductase [Trichodelitschia bisporula]
MDEGSDGQGNPSDNPLHKRDSPSPQDRSGSRISKKIHIIGTGSIGKLVAHSLRSLPNPPPVTLLLHKGDNKDAWDASNRTISITTNGITVSRSGFDVELARTGWRSHGKQVSLDEWIHPPPDPGAALAKQPSRPVPDADNTDPIANLIVTVKAPQTIAALEAVRQRLGPLTTICFLQNGMGIVDEVNKEIFPDPETRPQYLAGIITHGVTSDGLFTATHAGQGSISMCIIPREGKEDKYSASAAALLAILRRSPTLTVMGITPTEFLQVQLEKLAANAIINPLTSLIDANNGAILNNNHLTRAIRLLLGEISLVISLLPELKDVPNVKRRFSTQRLEWMVTNLARGTAANVSSMLADVRQGKQTEINYINGYICRRGEEVGVTCFMNYLVTQLVKGKQHVIDAEHSEELPLAFTKNFEAPWTLSKQ